MPKRRRIAKAKQRPLARSRRAAAPPPRARAATQPTSPITIACIGASAGGLEAFSELLNALPQDPGLALVLVQHLAPQHDSALPVLLSAKTKLPVVQAAEGMQVEPNRIYVIPPNVQMGIEKDVLHLLPRPRDRSQYMPIDYFLHALAESRQERAIGVILSGTASDGALGVREIKAVGGITFAQEPASAKYDGMPRAAIATGMVDVVLPPDRLAGELVDIARHPYLRRSYPPIAAAQEEEEASDAVPIRDEQLQSVFTLLRAASGVDFKHYKLPTIQRRLQRRMVLHKLTSVEQYLRHLHEHPTEVRALYQDLLINVTRFFRERDSFQVLAAEICPQIIGSQKEEHPIRAWVAGCASGEEAYSVAITFLECLADRANLVPIQLFATDISEQSIEQARTAFYPDSIAADVSPERLRRFFTKVDGGYRVSKLIRDLCIFARQDLARDPPFSKLDLVVCRNVLIYMTPALQSKVLTMFHYALKPKGFLMLGHAETVGTHSDLFGIADKRHRIYRKKHADTVLPAVSFPIEHVVTPPARRRASADLDASGAHAQHEANRLVLERYAPPGVIVDDELQIVQFRGQTGVFLEPAPGDPGMNLLKMAREGLLYGIRTAVHAARKSGKPVRKDGLTVKQEGGSADVSIEVVPLGESSGNHLLVLFHGGAAPASERPKRAHGKAVKKPSTADDERVRRLQDELAASREYLQSIIQEVEAANEELQSANEEILSSNEELQSTNEELDTAKEELQSTNEELNTVNEELHGRNEELRQANSDLVNLLGSVQIAIVIVDSDLRIRRFTPMAGQILNLIAADVGRPIGHLKPNIDCPDLEKLIAAAIDSVTPQEREVQDSNHNSFLLRIRAYKNVENRIDGAVLALFDIQSAKQSDRDLRQAHGYSDALFGAVPVPLLLLDEGMRIRAANDAFLDTFGYKSNELENRKLFAVGKGVWNVPQLRAPLEAVAADGRREETFALSHTFPRLGARELLVTARRIDDGRGHPAFLLTFIDAPVTGAPPE